MANFWKLANHVELPPQVKEILVATGYDSIFALSQLEEIKVIEAFLRENHIAFSESPKYDLIYGIYKSYPEKFLFLPGHAQRLHALINVCKFAMENSAEMQMFNVAVSKSKRQNPSNVLSIEYANSHGDDDKEITSQENETRVVLSDLTFEQSSPSSLKTSVPSPLLHFSRPLPAKLALLNETEDKLESYVFDDIKKKMDNWCERHVGDHVQKLELGRDYSLSVTRRSQLDSVRDNDPLLVTFTCIMCDVTVRMHRRESSYTLANATRHLAKCTGVIQSPDLKKEVTTNRTKRSKRRVARPKPRANENLKRRKFIVLNRSSDCVEELEVFEDDDNNIVEITEVDNSNDVDDYRDFEGESICLNHEECDTPYVPYIIELKKT